MAARPKPKTETTVTAGQTDPALPESVQVSTDGAVTDATVGAGSQVNDEPVAVAILVKAKVDRFRRAGLTFGREPVRIDIDQLTEAEIGALLDEPMLEAVIVTDDTEIESATASWSAKAADTAIRLRDTLLALRAASGKGN